MGDELQKLKEIFLKRGAMSPHSDFQVKFGNFPPLKKKIQNRLSPPCLEPPTDKKQILVNEQHQGRFQLHNLHVAWTNIAAKWSFTNVRCDAQVPRLGCRNNKESGIQLIHILPADGGVIYSTCNLHRSALPAAAKPIICNLSSQNASQRAVPPNKSSTTMQAHCAFSGQKWSVFKGELVSACCCHWAFLAGQQRQSKMFHLHSSAASCYPTMHSSYFCTNKQLLQSSNVRVVLLWSMEIFAPKYRVPWPLMLNIPNT